MGSARRSGMPRKGEKGESLDAKVVRLTLVVLALAGIAQIAVFGFSIFRQFSSLEKMASAEDLERFEAAVEAEKASLAELARDYAGWDDARSYVEGRNPRFADENFMPDWTDVARLDKVMVLSPGAEVLWSGQRIGDAFSKLAGADPDGGGVAPGSVFVPLVGAATDAPRFAFEKTGNGLLLSCAYPVTSSDYSAPPRGWIYFARRLDERILGRISERSGLGVELLAAAPPLPGSRELKAGSAAARYHDEGAIRHIRVPVIDAAGKEIALLDASRLRKLDAPAERLLVELALSLAAGAGITAVILLTLMRRRVVRPLVRIALHLNARAEKSATGARLDMGAASGRRDEIGVVSDRIDALLDGLESERKKLEIVNGELERMAQFDFLTGLANRRFFDDYAKREIKRISRGLRDETKKNSISVLIGDIDHFKLFNDRRGHLAGDDCLRSIAKVLEGAVHRPSDMACRFGGEEFIVLLPETDLEGAITVAENIRKAIHSLAIAFEESPVRPIVTMSLGAAAAPVDDSFNLEALIGRADAAMYAAKDAGRDSIKASDR
jgi:diguanylate cyclase (GGDEF)-like protein